MSLPIWQGQTSFAHTTGKLVRSLPAGFTTDDVFYFVTETANEVASLELPASGWSKIIEIGTGTAPSVANDQTNTATRLTVWEHRIDGGAGDADLRTFDPLDHIGGMLFFVRGGKTTGSAVVAFATNVQTPASTAVSAPTLNTSRRTGWPVR